MSKCKDIRSIPCEKVNPTSLDVLAQRLEELKKLFPETVREGQIDFDRLKKTLDGSLIGDTEGERYGLSWAGKNESFRHIQEPTTATLKPIRKQSVDFDHTQNLFIEGDNLQVLKVLQKSYYGAVKMIYIDPPYNTGSDSFIYPDRFAETQREYLERIGEKDAEGNLIKDGFWRKNSRDAGHFHSNWLSMMYPRLFLARNLLRQDGVIFVSIDDNEVHNLRMIMNEIFGEENFVAQVIWKNVYGGGSKTKYIVNQHEYLLCFARNKDDIKEIDLPPSDEARKRYTEKDDKYSERGSFFTQPLATTSMDTRPNLRFPIFWKGHEIWPEKQWQWSKERVEEALKNDELVIRHENGKYSVRYKQYLKDEDGEERSSKLFSVFIKPWTQEGTAEISELFGNGKTFAFPKPSVLIQQLISLCWKDPNAIILDFFAGSCSTAHAVMQFNAEDGGNRKFICVQMAEPCDENSEAFKAGFKTIADIGRERIRRAAKKIAKEAEGKLDFNGGKVDLGFKVFKLDESNFKEWRSDVKTAGVLERQMFDFIDNVKPNVSRENILFELMLKTGLDLNVPVEERKIGDNSYYRIDGGKLIICLEDKITKKLVDAILKEKPEKSLCLDRAFENNDQLKTNTILQMEAEKIEFKVI
jgi:adenine-specific DNA-methyltransferase